MELNTRNATSTLPMLGAGERSKTRNSPFVRPVQMELFARVTSYPPLGQTTCLRRVQKALRAEEDDDDAVRPHFSLDLETSAAT